MGISTGASCTGGTQIPLTKASASDGAVATATSSTAGSGTSASSSNAAAGTMITNAPWVGAAVAGGYFMLAA